MNILTMIPWSVFIILFFIGVPVFLILAFIFKGKNQKLKVKNKKPMIFFILAAVSLLLAILSMYLDITAAHARRKAYTDSKLFNNGGFSLSDYISDLESKSDKALDEYKENAESTISDVKEKYGL